MRLFAALLVLVPVSVLSQTPEAAPAAPAVLASPTAPPAPAESAPLWSLGAGVSLDYAYSYVMVSATGPRPPTFGATASIERRLSGRTWLAVGVAGAADHVRSDVEPGTDGVSGYDVGLLGVTVGVRRVLTPAGVPIDVSVTADLAAHYGTIDQSYVNGGVEQSGTALAWGVGATAGLAVERELTRGLALRIATPVVSAGVSGDRTDLAGGGAIHSTGFGARVELHPRLEARLAF